MGKPTVTGHNHIDKEAPSRPLNSEITNVMPACSCNARHQGHNNVRHSVVGTCGGGKVTVVTKSKSSSEHLPF